MIVFIALTSLFQNCSGGFGVGSGSESGSGSSTGASGSGGGTGAGGSAGGGGTGGAGCVTSSGIAQNFPCSMYFNKAVDQVVLTSAQKNYSDHLINGLQARGGWGNSNILQADFSIDVLNVPAGNTSFYSVNPNDGWTDADPITKIPAPAAGSTAGFESSGGTSCDDGDCHYLALDQANRKLYEVYRSHVVGSSLTNAGDGGIVVWPFDKLWTESLRGDVCTSADAGGFSIGAMLFSAEEIQAGQINHAIRFILPNNRIAYRTYVRPATHTTGGTDWAPAPTTDLTEAPFASAASEPGLPYGTRLRLKASVNIGALSAGAQVVAKAMKKYGIILADGGNIALTARSDQSSTVKYANVGFGARSLAALKVTDFEVVPPDRPAPFASGATFQPTVLGPMIKARFLDCTLNK